MCTVTNLRLRVVCNTQTTARGLPAVLIIEQLVNTRSKKATAPLKRYKSFTLKGLSRSRGTLKVCFSKKSRHVHYFVTQIRSRCTNESYHPFLISLIYKAFSSQDSLIQKTPGMDLPFKDWVGGPNCTVGPWNRIQYQSKTKSITSDEKLFRSVLQHSPKCLGVKRPTFDFLNFWTPM